MHAQTRNVLSLAAIAIALVACSVYRPEVRQGNYIEGDKISKVKPGMTHEQVRFLLGPPMIADGFHRSQWDYFFTIENNHFERGELRRHVIVRFDGDIVSSIDEPNKPAPMAPTADKRVDELFKDPAAAPASTPAEKPADAPVPPPPAPAQG